MLVDLFPKDVVQEGVQNKFFLPVLISILLLLGLVSLVSAKSSHRSFRLPPSARKMSENVYYLGEAAGGAKGYAFIHRAKGFARPPGKGNDKGKGRKCYDSLAKGAHWKTTEPYVLDETNSDGLTADFVSTVSETSLGTWDSQVTFNIFGPRDTVSTVDGADTVSPDNKNELYFGAIDEPGVIGVAIVWGYFSGPPSLRELVEWDMILDDVDYTWGDATNNPTTMDYQNVVTHEIGHAAGMGDLYESACSEETMFGYTIEGETKKRDLHTGDITGVKKLYE